MKQAGRRARHFASVSQCALILSGILTGLWAPVSAEAEGQRRLSPLPPSHKTKRLMCIRPLCHSMVHKKAQTPTPHTVAPPFCAPAPASPGQVECMTEEKIEVVGSGHSYTAPAAEAWGKTPVALKDIPQSVSVLTQQRMQDSNMLTMTDAMRQINGIRVLPGSTAHSNFYSRGYQMTTSVDNTPGAAGTLNNASFDLSMYDRIEVLRGSSGLLQGGGSPGGVVNQVTKKPGMDFSVNGAATVGSFNNYRADIDLSTPLNASKSLNQKAV